MCGDSTRRDHVNNVLGNNPPIMFITDPPYGVGDDSDESIYFDLCEKFMEINLSLGCFGLVTAGHKHNSWWFQKFSPESFLVWYDKTKQSVHKIAYLCKSELILSFGRPINKYAWDIFEIEGNRGDGLRELHSCPKPLELYISLIEPQTKVGDVVYDSFCGSGTTLAACEITGRVGRGIEIDPKYCAVILERLSQMGLEPKLIAPSAPLDRKHAPGVGNGTSGNNPEGDGVKPSGRLTTPKQRKRKSSKTTKRTTVRKTS